MCNKISDKPLTPLMKKELKKHADSLISHNGQPFCWTGLAGTMRGIVARGYMTSLGTVAYKRLTYQKGYSVARVCRINYLQRQKIRHVLGREGI